VVLDIEERTIEQQLRSPRPNRSVVKAALTSVVSILQNAAGNAIGSTAGGIAVFELLKHLH
jgi:hypothetical protein